MFAFLPSIHNQSPNASPSLASTRQLPILSNNRPPTMGNVILDRIVKLEAAVEIEKNKNVHLRNEINKLKKNNRKIEDDLYWMETDIMACNRYSRRENIELMNVDEKILQEDLEKYVLTLLKTIGVNVDSYKIVGVHRLGKKRRGMNRNVIVRFLNRKDAINTLKKKKDLMNTRNYKHIKVIENLCPKSKKIFELCMSLKRQRLIKSVWTYNGLVNIKFTDDEDEISTKIYHVDDIDYHISNNENNDIYNDIIDEDDD